eukprot:3908611-Amphidinium_carterae.1
MNRHPTLSNSISRQAYRNNMIMTMSHVKVYAGEYEGLTYDDIKKRMPAEAELRKLDKLGYRLVHLTAIRP